MYQQPAANKLYTQQDIDYSIKRGQWLLIFEGKVYDVTSWADAHPGGKLLLQHVLGKDATDQITINHSEQVLKRLNAFYVGDVDVTQAENVNRPLSVAFRQFHEELESQGFYHTDFRFYARAYLRAFALFALSLFVYWGYSQTILGCLLSAVLMGAFWQQIAFIGHDTGHNGITHSRLIDTLVGIFIGNLLTGVSIGWWRRSHNTHHLVTNDPEHDPDIQHLPFFAVTSKFFESVYSTFHERLFKFDNISRLLVAVQHITYLPIMMVVRPHLFLYSYIFLAKHKTYLYWLEIVTLIGFWCWYGTLIYAIPSASLRLVYFLVSMNSAFIVHLQINLSHFAMSTEKVSDDEEFVKHQLRTTLDVECPPWLDWFHGGLQFQVAHHLFPRMPRNNLRKATQRVIKFCQENQLSYNCKTFTEGNVHLVKHLKAIADQVRFLAHVASKANWD